MLEARNLAQILDATFLVYKRHFFMVFAVSLFFSLPIYIIVIFVDPWQALEAGRYYFASFFLFTILFIFVWKWQVLIAMQRSWLGKKKQPEASTATGEEGKTLAGFYNGIRKAPRATLTFVTNFAIFAPIAVALFFSIDRYLHQFSRQVAAFMGFGFDNWMLLLVFLYICIFVFIPASAMVLIQPVVANEEGGVWYASKRAWSLSHRQRIRICLCTLSLLGICYAIVVGIHLKLETLALNFEWFSLGVNILVSALLEPLPILAAGYLYFDARVRRGLFDLEILNEALAAPENS